MTISRNKTTSSVGHLLLSSVVVASTGFLLGPGPDSDAMLAFASECSGHYFEPLNLLLRAPACALDEPYLLQVLVWAIVALMCSHTLARRGNWTHIPTIMFITIICTGNYRIALAALFLAYASRTMRLPLFILAPLTHYSALPVLAIRGIAKTFRQLRGYQGMVLGAIGLLIVSVFWSEIEGIAISNASFRTHTQGDAADAIGANNVFIASAFYTLVFFISSLLLSKTYWTGFWVAIAALVTGDPLFTRLLIFWKVELVLNGYDQKLSRIRGFNSKYFVLVMSILLCGLTLRNDYYQ